MTLLVGYAILSLLVLAVIVIEEINELKQTESIWNEREMEYQKSLIENDVVY